MFDASSIESGGSLLAVAGLNVRFGGVQALTDVAFDVPAHEIVAVIGPNGAGKSTLLNSISGLVRGAMSGDITFAGQSIVGRSPVRIAGMGIGRSFQDPPMLDKESVIENVMLGNHRTIRYSMADQIWRRRKVRRLESTSAARAREVLKLVGLSGIDDHRVGSLAYGTRKLIDIARAMVSGPLLLLLDEPTSGLDPDEQTAVGQVLGELHQATGVTILLVEHHMHIVRSVCSKVVGLESGAVIVEGSAEQVLDSAAFRSIVTNEASDRGTTQPEGEPQPAAARSAMRQPWSDS